METPVWLEQTKDYATILYLGRSICIPRNKCVSVTTNIHGTVMLWIHKDKTSHVKRNDTGWTGVMCEEPIVVGVLSAESASDWQRMTIHFDENGKVKQLVEDFVPVETKTVVYFGAELTLPMWAKFVAVNKDGSLYVSSTSPLCRNGVWTVSEPSSLAAIIGTCKLSFGIPLYKTLVEMDK